MLIIGSLALSHHYPEFKRAPKDIDVVGDKNILIENELICESGIERIEYLENPIITKYQKSGFLSPDLLLSLKISHLFWDINWEKHIYDVHFLLSKGNKYDVNLILELREYWDKTHKKIRRSNLVSTKEEFFSNNVNNTVDEHDYLHTLLNPIPMFTLLLKDGSEVELDPTKWDNLNFEQKCDVVFEETAVMAFERYKNNHYREAFSIQLKDNIIKHFPFYIALFAIENYSKLQKPKINYRQLITNELCKSN